ncbi:MAG: stearoyl-CoA 9-desaturase [Chlorobi bacterium]|nr:stearoyl-CoA 9-desaturase [Chlorobiota bacterium]
MPRTTKKSTGDKLLNIGFVGIHVTCLLVIWAGISWTAVAVCVFLYLVRMFAVTAGYHRYFAHRTYKTSRVFQFILGFMGATSLQNGPLWWAAHHRNHHRFSDTEHDVHSPVVGGVWWAHVGWILSKKFSAYDPKVVHDLEKFPEIRWLNRHYIWAAVLMAAVLYGVGMILQYEAPQLHTSGFQLLIWGGFISTTILYHGTFTINSLAHMFGSRRFETSDDSRNNFFLALITLGEGWHNNHHRYLASERQGFYWWEIDISHYILKVLSWLGIVWDLKTPPAKIYQEAERRKMAKRRGNRDAIPSETLVAHTPESLSMLHHDLDDDMAMDIDSLSEIPEDVAA